MGFVQAMLRNKTDMELMCYVKSQTWVSPLEAELFSRWMEWIHRYEADDD